MEPYLITTLNSPTSVGENERENKLTWATLILLLLVILTWVQNPRCLQILHEGFGPTQYILVIGQQ